MAVAAARDDLPARMVDAGAILFTVLLAIFEIRHYVTGGNIYRPVGDLTEAALDVNVGLALTIGLERVRGRTGSIVHNVGALLIAALTLVAIVFELVFVASRTSATIPSPACSSTGSCSAMAFRRCLRSRLR
jgi:hypothetical protein